MEQIISFLRDGLLVGLIENVFYGFLTSTLLLVGTLIWRNTVKFSGGIGRGVSETFAMFRERRVQAALDEIAIVGRVYKILIYIIFLLPLTLFIAAALHIVGALVLHVVATDAVVGSTFSAERMAAWAFPGYLLALAVATPLAFLVFRGWVVRLSIISIMTIVVMIFGFGGLAALSPLVLAGGWILPTIGFASPFLSAGFGGWLFYSGIPYEIKERAQFRGLSIFIPLVGILGLAALLFGMAYLLGSFQNEERRRSIDHVLAWRDSQPQLNATLFMERAQSGAVASSSCRIATRAEGERLWVLASQSCAEIDPILLRWFWIRPGYDLAEPYTHDLDCLDREATSSEPYSSLSILCGGRNAFVSTATGFEQLEREGRYLVRYRLEVDSDADAEQVEDLGRE